jgi:hypothetical protein
MKKRKELKTEAEPGPEGHWFSRGILAACTPASLWHALVCMHAALICIHAALRSIHAALRSIHAALICTHVSTLLFNLSCSTEKHTCSTDMHTCLNSPLQSLTCPDTTCVTFMTHALPLPHRSLE